MERAGFTKNPGSGRWAVADSPGDIEERRESMKKLHVYIVRHSNGKEEIRFIEENEITAGGGVAAFEAHLRETVAWFHPLGQTKGRRDRRGGLYLPAEPGFSH
jgi:hypothetical protein